ncbi:MAG: response regulator [bacterium]
MILVVDDEPAIARMVKQLLEDAGYLVLATSDPHEAVLLAKENASELRLLVTDVKMPKMNGRDLATVVLAENPEVKCIFISGYTDGLLDGGRHHLIAKPFSHQDLTIKVEEVLHCKSG